MHSAITICSKTQHKHQHIPPPPYSRTTLLLLQKHKLLKQQHYQQTLSYKPRQCHSLHRNTKRHSMTPLQPDPQRNFLHSGCTLTIQIATIGTTTTTTTMKFPVISMTITAQMENWYRGAAIVKLHAHMNPVQRFSDVSYAKQKTCLCSAFSWKNNNINPPPEKKSLYYTAVVESSPTIQLCPCSWVWCLAFCMQQSFLPIYLNHNSS